MSNVAAASKDSGSAAAGASSSAAAAASGGGAKDSKKGHYVGIHASGFKDFLLKPELLRSIVDAGFEHPSEVQHESIPQAVLGGDIVCQAKSGMGKTAGTWHSLQLVFFIIFFAFLLFVNHAVVAGYVLATLCSCLQYFRALCVCVCVCACENCSFP